MTSLTIEEQKVNYSRELAAHTLRQWNAVNGSLNGRKKSEIDSSSPMSTTPDEFDNSHSKAQTPHNSDSVQLAVDFARIPSKSSEWNDVTSQNATY